MRVNRGQKALICRGTPCAARSRGRAPCRQQSPHGLPGGPSGRRSTSVSSYGASGSDASHIGTFMRFAPIVMTLFALAPVAAQAPTDAAQKEAREILLEMVSTNTSLQRGDVTPLAEKLAARFRKAGV